MQHPIDAYGFVGDMRTGALVAPDGSVDWLCLPRFDSPSVFGAILDDKRGGRFKLGPADGGLGRQRYEDGTNVLVTRFKTKTGSLELVDWMDPLTKEPVLARRLRCLDGTVRVRLRCAPSFDYGLRRGERAESVWTMERGQVCDFAFGDAPADSLERTLAFWRRWSRGVRYRGAYREEVLRSALALKLMTYAPTGAIVAAPTTSLPEGIGGVRNWDYRFTWLRDGCFAADAFLALGLKREAEAFLAWLARRLSEGPLQIMYGIEGARRLTERELGHLSGYRGSQPVRVGNGAYGQIQLDVYGEILNTVHNAVRARARVPHALLRRLPKLVEEARRLSGKKDEGIWEVRGASRHFVYSKIQCWTALDRGIKLARRFGWDSRVARWKTARAGLRRDILRRGFDEKRNCFVQAYDRPELDASALKAGLLGFVKPSDPRAVGTIRAVERELSVRGMMYRYKIEDETTDGLAGEEGTFAICSFWRAEALARAGKKAEARRIFESLLRRGGRLGLYSEQIGSDGTALGNYPQAFSHLSLIQAARAIG
jgi:GH15 family glucan-1,4-alpha-glucosidase